MFACKQFDLQKKNKKTGKKRCTFTRWISWRRKFKSTDLLISLDSWWSSHESFDCCCLKKWLLTFIATSDNKDVHRIDGSAHMQFYCGDLTLWQQEQKKRVSSVSTCIERKTLLWMNWIEWNGIEIIVKWQTHYRGSGEGKYIYGDLICPIQTNERTNKTNMYECKFPSVKHSS